MPARGPWASGSGGGLAAGAEGRSSADSGFPLSAESRKAPREVTWAQVWLEG